MIPGRLPHHLALRGRPVPLLRQPPDLEPLPQRGQLPPLRPRVPHRRTVRQQQLRPAPPRLLLLAGQPVPQRGYEVVVGELVVFRTGLPLGNAGVPLAARARNSFCPLAGAPSGSRPNARPNAASTLRAWSRSKRSTRALLCPSASLTSSSRMNRLTASQKSSRTSSRACTWPPSHCRRA